MRVILIGFMGAGKSFLGKKLSRKIQLPFYDTDEIIEETHSRTINDIFTREGEQVFRYIEREILLSVPDDSLIAAGGGIINRPINRDYLKKANNFVIWLHPEWDTIYNRIQGTDRPYVVNLSERELMALWEKRLSLYEECADYVSRDCSIEELLAVLSKRGTEKQD